MSWPLISRISFLPEQEVQFMFPQEVYKKLTTHLHSIEPRALYVRDIVEGGVLKMDR